MENKINYQRELEKQLEAIDKKVPRLLLHVCCAPCSSYVLEYLSEYFEITVFYYNPNISPESEFRFRADEEKRFIGEISPRNPIHYVEGVYDSQRYFEQVRGLESAPEGGERCNICFKMRLEEAARLCSEQGFDCFSTTLTISPLKSAEKLNRIGEQAAKKYNTVWLPSDFKKKNGYKRSIELSHEHNLYRQNYCGCIFSKAQAQQHNDNE